MWVRHEEEKMPLKGPVLTLLYGFPFFNVLILPVTVVSREKERERQREKQAILLKDHHETQG
jgi:hypothetical protein